MLDILVLGRRPSEEVLSLSQHGNTEVDEYMLKAPQYKFLLCIL